ncbi:MAG: NifB/NifX family molybdenum-iron cluster-binding protein [Deltaproteobacteria bacterium]|nr:NifB/NifX family molybdenum-iron cluster-binding protein [Deltaproteobacteria bacterium]
MNLCIPIRHDEGLDSRVSPHFGSAPAFMVVDVDSKMHQTIANAQKHHEHGQCSPFEVLLGHSIDAIAVGGIGAGALSKLLAANIPVYMTKHATVDEVVEAYKLNGLRRLDPNDTCTHHGRGHDGHGHRHGPSAKNP